MRKHKFTEVSIGLERLANYINALVPQLPKCLGDDPHKTRYLRRAVMRYEWAQQPISQLTTSQYSYIQLVAVLNASLQLQEEISSAGAPEVNYGQYINGPRAVRRHSHQRGRNIRRWLPKRNSTPYSQRRDWQPAHSRYASNSSQSPGSRHSGSIIEINGRHNPNIRHRQFCWGCGSPEHILSDQKCTAKLQTIKTNIVDCIKDQDDGAKLLAQFLTLHSKTCTRVSDATATQPGSAVNTTPRRNMDLLHSAQFEEAMYDVEEQETIQARISQHFRPNIHDIQYMIQEPLCTKSSTVHTSTFHEFRETPRVLDFVWTSAFQDQSSAGPNWTRYYGNSERKLFHI